MSAALAELVREVPDHPRPGVTFMDLTPLFADGNAFGELIEGLSEAVAAWQVDLIVGIEARGFIVGAPVAARLGSGFVPVRKPGKLPVAVHRQSYELEYGTDALELHRDAIAGHHRVAVIDDVLATGGTLAAVSELIGRCGAELVGAAVVMELSALGARRRLAGLELSAMIEVG